MPMIDAARRASMALPALPLVLWLLVAAFAGRVAGQLIQKVSPVGFLPDVAAFQGSRLPYWALLSTQIVILCAMVVVTARIQRGTLRPSARVGSILGRLGALYLGVSIVRIAIGLFVPQAPAWFSTWLPAIFHLVLAGWVLLVAVWHRAGTTDGYA